jgi:hypothetical protein
MGRYNDTARAATRLCVDVHDLPLSKYAAGREKDVEFNRELVRHGIVSKRGSPGSFRRCLSPTSARASSLARINVDFAAASPRGGPEPRRS